MPKAGLRAHMQQGCIGCKPCEGGISNIARSLKIFFLAIFTLGLGLLIIPFFKKCVYCGHSMFLNKHKHGGEHIDM